MRATASMTGLRETLDAGLGDFERAVTGAMGEANIGLKEEYRDQTFGAGLGRKLAYTWQGNVYPKSGASLEPSAYVWSKAPKIISLFASGAVIRPVKGGNYLWIPTSAVPRRRGRGAKARMMVQDVEKHFGSKVFIRNGRAGRRLAYVNPAAAGRGKRGKPILVFVLVRQVQGRKLIDLQGPADRWAARFPRLVEKHWRS